MHDDTIEILVKKGIIPNADLARQVIKDSAADQFADALHTAFCLQEHPSECQYHQGECEAREDWKLFACELIDAGAHINASSHIQRAAAEVAAHPHTAAYQALVLLSSSVRTAVVDIIRDAILTAVDQGLLGPPVEVEPSASSEPDAPPVA